MAGSTNVIQWNPTQANQESDSQYSGDSQRQSGATSGAIFADPLANKLFYQMSTVCTALCTMLANKGYVANDTSMVQLAAIMANILTQADLPTPLLTLAFSPTLTFNAATARGWDITLTGNVVTTFVTNAAAGQVLTFLFRQDGTGGRTVSAPSTLSAVWIQPDPGANAVSTIQYLIGGNNDPRPIGGGMTVS